MMKSICRFYLHYHSLFPGQAVFLLVQWMIVWPALSNWSKMLSIVMMKHTQLRQLHRSFIMSHTITSIFTNSLSSQHLKNVEPHSCACSATLLRPVFIQSSISTSCILTSVAMCVNEAIVAAIQSTSISHFCLFPAHCLYCNLNCESILS